AKFQAWANSKGFLYQATGAKPAPLRTDGVLDNATMAVLAAHSAVPVPTPGPVPTPPMPPGPPPTPTPVVYQPGAALIPGQAYFISFAPGALNTIAANWQ